MSGELVECTGEWRTGGVYGWVENWWSVRLSGEPVECTVV